jgi:hypothetical protein
MPAIDPGKPDSYLDAATVFWDYFQYADALRLLNEGRTKLKNPSLFAYEAGAIYEGRRNYGGAVREYLQAAINKEDSPSERRLVQLAKRRAYRALVDRATPSRWAGRPGRWRRQRCRRAAGAEPAT